jgi:hypothetical protein
MKQKIKLIVLFVFLGVSAMAQPKPYVEIAITPSEEKSGSIVINISNLKSTDYNRLILLTLPMELTPSLPIGVVSHKFNGCWYIDNEKNKTQLWLGNVLTAGKTDLQMQMELPNMMRSSDNVHHSYKLILCPNYLDGLHKFLSLTDKDSTEIVFANKIIFKGNQKYPVLSTEPANLWEKTDENVRKYTFSIQNSDVTTYLVFGVPNVVDTIKFLSAVFLSLIVSFFAGLGLYNKIQKSKQQIVLVIVSGLFVSGIIFIVLFALFNNLEFDGKIAFESAAPIIGYIGGMLTGLGNNKTS